MPNQYDRRSSVPGGEASFDAEQFHPETPDFERAQARRRHHDRARREQPQSGDRRWTEQPDRGVPGAEPGYFNKARQRAVDAHYGVGTSEAILKLGVQVCGVDFEQPGGPAVRGDQRANVVTAISLGTRADDFRVHDFGDMLKVVRDSPDEIAVMIELAQSKGWTTMNLKGSPAFCAAATEAAQRAGLKIGRVEHTEPNPRAVPQPEPVVPDTAPGGQAQGARDEASPAPTESKRDTSKHEAPWHDSNVEDLEQEADGVFRTRRRGPRMG